MRPKAGAPRPKESCWDLGLLHDSPKDGDDSTLEDFEESENSEQAVEGRVRSSWLLEASLLVSSGP